jgi:uncharacterized integral membrane protein (TIGR00698 family)
VRDNIIKNNIRGIVTVTSLVAISIATSRILLSYELFISSSFICIFLGLIIGNLFKSNDQIEFVINISLKRILRIGIAFLGISLSFSELFGYGAISFFLVFINIIIAFLSIYILCRFFKIPKDLGYLIAIGTSICGATAIIAAASIIKPSKNETSYAIGIVTIFGMFAVLTYPYLANLLFDHDAKLAGIFLGSSIHDTAQVSAAGLIYSEIYASEIAMNSAMTTKLLRNSFLIFLIPLLACFYNSQNGINVKNSIKTFFPYFVIGFLGMSILRTFGDMLILNKNLIHYWEYLIYSIKTISKYCILFAMVSLGLQTNLKRVSKLGFNPLLVGSIAAIIIGISSILYLKLFA